MRAKVVPSGFGLGSEPPSALPRTGLGIPEEQLCGQSRAPCGEALILAGEASALAAVLSEALWASLPAPPDSPSRCLFISFPRLRQPTTPLWSGTSGSRAGVWGGCPSLPPAKLTCLSDTGSSTTTFEEVSDGASEPTSRCFGTTASVLGQPISCSSLSTGTPFFRESVGQPLAVVGQMQDSKEPPSLDARETPAPAPLPNEATGAVAVGPALILV